MDINNQLLQFNIMSNFIKLRIILQEQRPEYHKFVAELGQQTLKNSDLDLLLRKAVEERVPEFPHFCRALVSKGANVNFYDSKDHVSNLMIACEKGNLEMVNALLLHKDINLLHSDMRQSTAGFYAIDNKSREDGDAILRRLLERQPALINKEAGNQTLLIAAIRKSKVEIVKYLLQLGSDPNWQVPDTGNTALHDAVKQLKLKVSKAISQIIRLLLIHGGDSTKKNKQQKTVYEYAERALGEYHKIQQSAIQQIVMAETKVQLLMQLNSDAQIHSMLLQADSLFAKYQGDDSQSNKSCFLTELQVLPCLTKQMAIFEKQCLSRYDEARKQIDNWIQKADKIIAPDGLAVELYGSFATSLWIQSSNINLLIVHRDFPYEFNFNAPKDTLEKIFDSLSKASICKQLNITRNVRMPSIIVSIGEGAKTKNIHLTLLDRAHNGRAITRFILQQQQNYPLLRPMFYVIKQLTCQYGLNQPKTGGIRTYALIIMLLSCIAKWSQLNPAKLLLDFLYYFGFYYDYHYQAKSDPNDHLQKECMVLQILDPLNASNNVGKHVKASNLQSMFRAAYISLHADVGSSHTLKTMFDSHLVMLS